MGLLYNDFGSRCETFARLLTVFNQYLWLYLAILILLINNFSTFQKIAFHGAPESRKTLGIVKKNYEKKEKYP